MSFPLIVVMCVFGVLCLTPLALYLIWLGVLNRRPHPSVIGGQWDFVILVAGLFGFILFGGGLLVAALQSNARLALRWNEKQFVAAYKQERLAWASVAGGYLLLIAGGVALSVASRSRTLSVYNVDRDQVEAAMDATLAEAGITGTRYGDVWTQEGRPVLEVRSFHGFRHATVRMLDPDPRHRQEIERGLRMRLADVPSPENPAGGWLTSMSIGCMLCMIVCLGLVAYFLYLVN